MFSVIGLGAKHVAKQILAPHYHYSVIPCLMALTSPSSEIKVLINAKTRLAISLGTLFT